MADLLYGWDMPGSVDLVTRGVAGGRSFAITKASQNDFEYSTFAKVLAAIKATDLIPGCFHFIEHAVKVPGYKLVPSLDPGSQAGVYLDVVNHRNGGYDNLLLALDVEDWQRTRTLSSGKKVVIWRSKPTLADVDAWVARFRLLLPTAYLLLYTRAGIWSAFGNPNIHARYGDRVLLWLADWKGQPDFTLHIGGRHPTIHQFTDSGILFKNAHHTYRADLDATNLTLDELKAVANWVSVTPPPPPPPPDTTHSEIGCPDEGIGGTGVNDPSGDFTLAVSDETWDGKSSTVKVGITVTPADPSQAVEFDYATADDTAHAGTHYAATSGHAVIAIGEDTAEIPVPVLWSSAFSGDKLFTLTISNPVNAVLGDDTGSITLPYAAGDPAMLPAWNSWTDKVTVYDQFHPCKNMNECTAFAVGTLTSLHEYRDTGAQVKFDARKLFIDSHPAGSGSGQQGDPLVTCVKCLDACKGWAGEITLAWAKSHGVKQVGSATVRHLGSWKEITAKTKADTIAKVKRAIYRDGGVQMELIFFSAGRHLNTGSTDWNIYRSTGRLRHNPHGILPDPGTTRSTGGHDWILVGWNDNIDGKGTGGFLVQNSFGSDWGVSGRGWLRYQTVTQRRFRNGTPSQTWMRFYRAALKPGG